MKTVVKLCSADVIANSYKNTEGMVLRKNKIFQSNSV